MRHLVRGCKLQAFPYDILEKKSSRTNSKLEEIKTQFFGKFSCIVITKPRFRLHFVVLRAELNVCCSKRCCFLQNTSKTHGNTYEYFKILIFFKHQGKNSFFARPLSSIQHCRNYRRGW